MARALQFTGRRLALGGVLVLALGLAWSLRVADTRLLRTPPDEITRHRALHAYARVTAAPAYVLHCARCHGLNLRGRPAAHTPDLTDRTWLYGQGDVSEIERTVLFGIRSGAGRAQNLTDMPAFLFAGRLSRQDIQDVSAYVLRLRGQPAPNDQIERGRAIFDVKGVCYDCHGATGGGNSLFGAPDLRSANYMYGSSRAEIVSSISEGRHGICPQWVDRLRAAEIRALAVLIHDASRNS